MNELRVGVGKSKVTPKVGSKLVGYFNRPEGSKGVHDELYARALVIDNGEMTIAICAVELLWLWGKIVVEIREQVAQRCGLKPEQILIACTHTHAGAAPHETEDWDTPLANRVADAIVTAYESRQPARIGFGFGMLFGYSINRRWLNRPVDPSVGVMRVDTADGKPLAILSNYGCHAVVMGYDNYLISGDWPSYSSRMLEEQFPDCIALFTQGGAGDVNPLTETVRQKLAAGYPVGTIGDVTSFYGQFVRGEDDRSVGDCWNIEDRGGGTFLECHTLALAVNAEITRVWKAIETTDTLPIWTEQIIVNAARDADEPPALGLPEAYYAILPQMQDGYIPVEVMLVGLGSAVFSTQPGEVFSETAVDFRKMAQQIGYSFPWLISYANGSYSYMPPENAFAEGGYEVDWPNRYGLSRRLQNRVREAIFPILQQKKG